MDMKSSLVVVAIVTSLYVLQICGHYTHYPKQKRYCIPYHDCPPGHEIVPCKIDFTNDTCIKCRGDMVQPEWISSNGDPSTTNCFKATSKCLADDITYRRHPAKAFCPELSGCKCNTLKCYQGDPCMCDSTPACRAEHYMNDTGQCVRCPPGTEKNYTGCGPCKRIRQTVSSFVLRSSREIPQQEQEDNTTLFILVAVLGVVLLILLVIIMILASRRAGFVMFSGVCWTDNRLQNRVVVDRNQHIQLEVAPLVPNQNQNVLQGNRLKTDNKNVIANPVIDHNSQMYPNSPQPRDRLSSGFGSDISDSSSQGSAQDKSVDNDETKATTPENRDDCDINDDESKSVKAAKSTLPHLDINESLSATMDYQWSDSKSPVAEESEPPKFGSPKVVYRPPTIEDSQDQRDTSGYSTYSIDGNPSGSYMSMHVSDPQSYQTEELSSALEEITCMYNMTDKNYTTKYSDQQKEDFRFDKSITHKKHTGPDSLSSVGGDSGIQIE